MEILQANNILKIYGDKNSANSTTALKGIDLKINKGEFLGVMGPSGSGKSTLISILSGITSATTGTVYIDGQDLNEMNKYEMALFRRRKLGFVFQEFNLMDNLTLKENVMLPMVLDKKPAKEMIKKSEEIMSLFGINEIGDKYPCNVSGGQQQRVAVSRALVNDPAIIFADEPTGNLDSKSSKVVMNSFEQMNEERKVSILMVTHDVFAASFCKRIIFIKDGKISMELINKWSRKEFLDRILDCLAIIGGEGSDL